LDLLCCVLIGLASTTASADDFINTGGYLVLGGMNGFEQFQNTKPFVLDVDNTMGFEIKGGYRAHKFLAAEFEGVFLSGFDGKIALGTIDPAFPLLVPLTVDGGHVMTNVLGYLPFGRFQPYAMVGLGGMWTRVRTTNAVLLACSPGVNPYGYAFCNGSYANLDSNGGFVMQFGGGLDVYVTEDWALTVDGSYVMPFGDISDFRYVKLGWGVRFNF
jgi:opacity protein-like surface antigen